MPPPVPRDTYAVALGNIRQLLSTVKGTPDPKEVTLKAFQAIEATTEIAQKFLLSIGALEDKVETWELSAPSSYGGKPLSESKCVGNLKNLGSDKAEFKSWNDKLINAMAQTLGTEWRGFMKNLNKALDQERKVIAKEDVIKIEGAAQVDLGTKASENLFYVLVEKTD